MKRRLIAYDAQGTDGTDTSKVMAVYQVLDDEGFTSIERVPLSKSDHDAELRAIAFKAQVDAPAQDIGTAEPKPAEEVVAPAPSPSEEVKPE